MTPPRGADRHGIKEFEDAALILHDLPVAAVRPDDPRLVHNPCDRRTEAIGQLARSRGIGFPPVVQ